MKFIIKTTGIADRLSVLVSSPQSRGGRFAVGTAGPFPPGRRLKVRVRVREEEKNQTRFTHQSSFRFDKRSILSVHFIVKTTGITEIMAISISPPQWSGSGPAVDTLSALWKEKSNEETAMMTETILATNCALSTRWCYCYYSCHTIIQRCTPLCNGYSSS